MTEHTTELRGLSLPRRLWNTLQNDDHLRPGVIAFLGGTLTAMEHITGETAPFGVAFAAAAPAAVTVPALLGAHWVISSPPKAPWHGSTRWPHYWPWQ